MQELLGRLVALDPDASQGLRIIACFDELMVGNVNTRAFLSAAAALAGCPAGYRQQDPPRTVRVDVDGSLLPGQASDLEAPAYTDGQAVWLERTGAPWVNDALIIERLGMALRLRHGRGRAALSQVRDLGQLLDADVDEADRLGAADRLGLDRSNRYRVVAAPLFAAWQSHPVAPEDVVPTRFGPIHALVVDADGEAPHAVPLGVGSAASAANLSHSFRAALVALRLADGTGDGPEHADRYGGLVDVLADAREPFDSPDVDLVEAVAQHPWGPATLAALTRAGSVREAARIADVHHSTMGNRLEVITDLLGFDPLDGMGRTRLGLAHLMWRLRRSTTLDMPASERRLRSPEAV